MRIGGRFVVFAFLFVTACSESIPAGSPEAQQGPLAEHARVTASFHQVPGDLVLAIAVVEKGLMLPKVRALRDADDIAIAGIMELRRGHFDSLERGAKLVGRSEIEIQIDTDLGTEAGIRVLAELGERTGARGEDWRSWAEAVERLSGYANERQAEDYRAEVFRILRTGGSFPARDGEIVVLPPRPEVPIELTLAPPLPRTLATPDFPDAIWFPTSCTNKCNTTRNRAIDAIVIHDTEGGWHASVATLQHDPGKSAHYIIDEDGSRVGQFIPESYMGWHAGNSCWNNRSIGIEHVGYAAKSFDIELYRKSVELIENILTRHDIPVDRDHIIGHHQVPNPNTIGQCVPACTLDLEACIQSKDYGGASGHYDPGPNWQWCQYMEMLGGSCRCQDTHGEWTCTTDGSAMWRCNEGLVEKQSCAGPCEVMPSGTADACEPPEADVDAGPEDASIDVGEPDAKGEDAALDGESDAEPEADAGDAETSEPAPWPELDDAAIVGEELGAASSPNTAEAGGCRMAPSASAEGKNHALLPFLLACAALARRRAGC